MFVDEAELIVRAGDGGDGMVAFRKEKYINKGGPNGGDGGRGGDVILIATNNCNTLDAFRHHRTLKADDGRPGGIKNMTGRSGEEQVAEVPVGTIVTDLETGEVIADMTRAGEKVVVARGGDGGQGNARFATSTNRTPRRATPGWPGEERHLNLELKLIADIALVGYPSVGKSTLIAALSNARPKIGDYPFTTITPNLGVVKWKQFREFVIADVPGLIEGAHEGHGLGTQFLKHIERTELIAHIIEVTPQLEGHEDERDPIKDFHRINHEMASFSAELENQPQLVVLNKCDLPFVARRKEELRAYFEDELELPFIAISAANHENLEELKKIMGQAVDRGEFADQLEDWEKA